MSSKLDVAAKLTGIVAAISAIVGGLFALWTFEQESAKRLDDKKKATLQFVQMFNSSEFLSVRTKALRYIDDGIVCDLSIIKGPERLNVFTYVDFFDSVKICVDQRVCDEPSANEFFERYANYHWPGFKLHIMQTRKFEKDFGVRTPYGSGLEKMARNPVNLKPFVKCLQDR